MSFENTLAFAQEQDAKDELKRFRNEFIIPTHKGKDAIYFLGNSLGLQPRRTSVYIQQVLEQWAEHGVEGFFRGGQPWLQYHDQLTTPLDGITGALPHEVVVMNGLTVNLHLMLASFYQPAGKRKKILCETKAFPSDQYMLETHVRQRGLNPDEVIVEVPADDGAFIKEEAILTAIEQHKDELALVLWGGVNYYSGQVFNIESITTAAKATGAKVGFDLAHAAGNVLLKLHHWDVDFACWCNYKYLNSGPGAVAAAYIHERYHNNLSLQRLAGWWGFDKATRFRMQKGFVPVPTAEGWQLSTPSPIQYAAVKAALELFEQAGMETLYKKGQQLGDYLLFIINKINEKQGENRIKVLTPPDAKGCQISLLVQQSGRSVFEYLSSKGVFADWREPGVIRVAPVPLYNTFEEVWHFGQIIEKALEHLYGPKPLMR